MSKSENRNKSKMVALRLTPEEYEAVVAEAAATGISMSEFLRRAVAEELGILRQQRVIREEERRRRFMPHGTTHGNTLVEPATITYLN